MAPEFDWEVDPKLEEEGEWIPLPELSPRLKVLVRSPHSDTFKTLHAKLLDKIPPRIAQKSGRALREYERIQRQCYAQAALIGWSGLMDKAGNEIEYDEALKVQLMSEKRHRLFQDAVFWAADQVGKRDKAWEEEVEGNSETESATES